MSKHTPGRWYKEPAEDGGRVLVDDARSTIIHVPPGSPLNPECAADAQLISAAPDLLEALKMLSEDHDWTTSEWDLRMKAVVDSAIAKATGK